MENYKDIYQMVTDKIIAHLKAGTIPWRRPWSDSGLPKNLLTKKPYRGVNIMILNSLGYAQNYFLTFEQVKAVGGFVKRGAKSEMIVFWKWIDVKNPDTTPPDEKKKQKPVLRFYKVFNVDQCTGIPADLIPPIKRENHPILACERIIENMPNKPTIQHEDNQAYYVPSEDYVNMPQIEYFVESESYYATLFHELIHSTGHSSRLNRKELVESTGYGSDQYSQEELIAEIGSCNLKSYVGIISDELANSAAYIQGWIAKLQFDPRCIVYASAQAQKATDYILNIEGDKAEDVEHTAQTELEVV